jgi:nitroreductase
MGILETIQKRISVRNYSDLDMGASVRQTLLDLGHGLGAPFGHRVRLTWVQVSADRAGDVRTLSTYGMIRGASWYLVGAVEKGPGALEDFGYLFEAILLRATELGLGTCWLGGTFDRSFLADHIGLKADEVLPAIAPVGYPAGTRHWQERLVTTFLQVRNRKPLASLIVGEDGRPLPDGENHPLAAALEAVRLGPSAANKQPWRLALAADGRRAHFYLQEIPGYNLGFKARAGFIIQAVDLGIAYYHWERVLAEDGVVGTWSRGDPALPVPPRWSYFATWTR